MNKRYKVKYEIVNTIAEKHNIISCKQNILLAYMYRDYVLGVFGSAFEIYIKKVTIKHCVEGHSFSTVYVN